MKRIIGTYCPLCGELDLLLDVDGDELWAWCPTSAKKRKDAHTAFQVSPERVADLLPKRRVSKPSEEDDNG